MSLVRIVVNSSDSTESNVEQLSQQGGEKQCLSRWFGALSDGAFNLNAQVATINTATITESIGAVAAAGLITLSSFVNADTVTIGVTTLTGATSTQDATHFKIGLSDTATAANLVTCIAANTTLNKFVTSVQGSGAGTVLVTAIVPGYVGNFVPLAISAHGSVSGSVLGTGTGSVAGVEGTLVEINA